VEPDDIRSAAEAAGLRLPAAVYATVAAALGAGKHLILTGPPGAGKTTLALAIAQAAARAGRSDGASLATASPKWSARDTMGDGEAGIVVAAARRGRWLVVDELDRARLDRAFGPLSSLLAGLPLELPGGEEIQPPDDWRLVATWGGASRGDASAALLRRFAHVELPLPDDLEDAVEAAAGEEATAAAAVRRLLALRDEVRPLGAGVFLDAARHAAGRHAVAPADEVTLAREAYQAYVAPLLDEEERRRAAELLDAG
jgi:MoxR-like ATPase